MAFNPMTTWPYIVESIDNVKGSKTYQTRAYEAGGQRYKFGDVIHCTDFDDFDETVHISLATAYEFKLMEYSNKAYIRGKVYCPGQGEYSPLYMQLLFVDENGNQLNIQGLVDQPLSGNVYYFETSRQVAVTPRTLKWYGIKCAYVTDYFDVNTLPIDNVTQPQLFYLQVFFPTETIDHDAHATPPLPYGRNELEYIQPGGFVGWVEDPEEEGFPYICFDFMPIYARLIATTDIEDFASKLVAAGDLKNIPFTIGDGEEGKPEGDPSGPGGGDGNYDDDSDPVDFPPLPTNGAMTSGSIMSFAVSNVILKNLFLYLWNTSIFDVATWQKLLEAPLDSLVKLSCVPIAPTVGSNREIYLGNIATGVTASVITSQYYTIDCGQIAVKRFFGSALDYDPYTKVEIFLPFIGVRQLKTEDVMNTVIHVKYNVDILTGEMVAFIKCGQSVLYHFSGQGIQEIPVSARDKDWLHSTVMALEHAGASGNAAAGISAAVNVALTKTQVSRSGSLSGSASLLDDFVPYLIIHRPQQSLPQNFKKYKGYPSNITATLSSLKGYTEVEHINLNVPGASDIELEEIETLLKEGVII